MKENQYAWQQGLMSCHICNKLAKISQSHCERCGAKIHSRQPRSLQRTIAFIMTSILLYFPANLLPIMYTNQLGSSIESTILGGIILLWQYESYPIAVVIFVASVIVPIAKLFSLCWLCRVAHYGSRIDRVEFAMLYRVTELVGRWSMVDVFVVAVLAALVKLTGIITIKPGIAAFAFAGVVVMTMFAAHSFDQRLIWDNHDKKKHNHRRQ